MAQIKPQVGMTLYGYCGGEFGRDSYRNKTIEFVAYDYIVARNVNGEPEFACTYDKSEFLIDEKYLNPEEEY